ncbi:MAG: hypothetical protein PVI86_07995 [Phycisphaerae bacterium]|jgi:hypothetical protein
MNPINAYISPLSAGRYVPHLYGFRQLHGYEHPLKRSRPLSSNAKYAAYDFSVDVAAAPHNDGPQTVEQVIAQGYFAVPDSEPEIAIIHDKKRTAWLGLDDVIAQIRQRYDLLEENLADIEQRKCDAINALFTWEVQYRWPSSAKEQYVLGKRLQALYADQRTERVAAWRDIARLRQSLPEVAQQYLSAFRKLTVLEDTRGDDP